MKGLKTILGNPDILTRFRLLQLWAVDAFTNSLKNDEPRLANLINETMLNVNEEGNAELMLSTLIELKKEYEEYNDKLERVNKIIQIQNKYAKILKNLMGEDEEKIKGIDGNIEKNKKIIDGINNLTLNKINDICQN